MKYQVTVMVFKIICLFFHLVDMILSVIDMTRGFISFNIKRLSGGGKVCMWDQLYMNYTVTLLTRRKREAPTPPQWW